MALINCPECGRENVSSTAKACPSCGYNIREHIEKPANKESNTADSIENKNNTSEYKTNYKALIITIAVIAMLVLSLWFFSTRCKMSGCFRTRESNESYCTYHRDKLDYLNAKTNSLLNDYSTKNAYDLKISNVTVHNREYTCYCEGTITNNGTETYKFVQVKGSFKNFSGSVVETGSTYAVGGEGLSPNESTTFKIYCDKNYDIEDCDVSVYSYD
ncbi:MAG: zinc ribbon domain-containing protein [Ruminococcus sp.]|nr:zinc ribbon domain-containing protein [Ruminococcus sp.]